MENLRNLLISRPRKIIAIILLLGTIGYTGSNLFQESTNESIEQNNIVQNHQMPWIQFGIDTAAIFKCPPNIGTQVLRRSSDTKISRSGLQGLGCTESGAAIWYDFGLGVRGIQLIPQLHF